MQDSKIYRREVISTWSKDTPVEESSPNCHALQSNISINAKTNEVSAVTYWERKGWPNLAFRCRSINVITSHEMKHYFIQKDSVECTRAEFVSH